MTKYLHESPVIPRTDEEKEAIINRLKRIEGQVRGIQRMVEEDRYCIDILVQIKSIKAAIDKVGYGVTERHIKECINDAINNEEGKSAVEELLKVMEYISK